MWKKISFVSVLFILLASLLLSVSLSSASVSYFEISPENPVKGDIVTIEGKASPSEVVPVKLSFEEDLSVVNGKYEWRLSSVEIPKDENRFTVTATNVNNLNVALRFIFIWITRSADAENGIATISQSNVPGGTYNAKVSGKSDSDEVSIKVDAEAFLNADATGDFEYTYDTSSIPAGEFVVTVKGITKTVELLETEPTPTPTPTLEPTPTPSSPSGGGSGAPAIPLIPTPTPNITIPGNVTQNETATSSPTLIPTLTPASTTAPQTTPPTTPHKTDTGEKTPGPTSQNKTNQSSQKTTKPSHIPSFELIECMVALIIIIMLKRVSGEK